MHLSDKKLTDLLCDDSFVRWIKGKAYPIEQKRWDQWEIENILNQKLKKRAESLFSQSLELDEGNDLDVQLNRLESRIDKASDQSKGLIQHNKSKVSHYYMAVAAAIALLVTVLSSVYYFYQSYSSNEGKKTTFAKVETRYGEKKLLTFNDGSSIRLNSGSTLRYKQDKISSNHIEVWLSGEGYFNISHNPNGSIRLFIVHTPDGEVRDLGTKFDVDTRCGETSVVLERGKVQVIFNTTTHHKKIKKVLLPGERAVYSASQNNIRVQEVDTKLYTSWVDGKIKFHNTSLQKIIRNIESTYGVTIEVENSALLDEKITGTLQNPDLKTLLESLKRIFHLKIKKINADKYILNK